MSPKIVIFSTAYFPFVGGAEVAVKEITDRLPDDNFFCFTYKFDRHWLSREKISNVEVIRIGSGGLNQHDYYGHFFKKILYAFRAWRTAEQEHKKKSFKLIWAIMASYGGMAALFFKLRHPSIPLLLTLQEGDSESHILRRVGIFYPLWRFLFKKADYIQVISNYLMDFARRHGARCPIEVVPNGVNVEAFSVKRMAYSEKSKTLNAKPYTLITTSRLVHKNGIDTLIRTVAELKKYQVSSIRCQVLGSGPDEEKLKKLASDLGVADKIEFLGHVDPDKIPNYLAGADIFVRPSRSEGLGNSFLEAMAAGLPIIGTPVGGISDFLKDGETGLFCQVDDFKDVAGKIKGLMENDILRNKIAENGRKLVLENYSWDKIASKIKNIFQALITNYKLPITRLLVATGIYPPEIGGPATYTALLEKELPKHGMSIAVLPFRVVRRWPIGIRHLIYFFKCLLRARRNDIVYSQDPVSVGLPAMLAAKVLRKPFIMRVAGDYAWEQAAQRFGVKDSIDEFQQKRYGLRTELLRSVQKFVANQAKIIITPSQYFQKLVGGWIKNPEKVKVIYNGIQLDNPPSKKLINSSTHQLKTILSAGRLVPWKGFDVLIDLMRDLPDWKLVIVGDGPEREALGVKCQVSGVKNKVDFLDAVPREKLLELLHSVTVFVLNTSFESFSFQVVEAMNAGLPVITTKIGNLAEIIDDGKEGILVEPNRKEQILAAIRKIGSDKNFREKIVRNAKEKAKQFSIGNCMTKLVEILNTLNY